MHDPDLLILDELFSGLDPVNAELMKDVMLELKDAGRTIVFSTHMMEQAEKLCDDICLINRSRKVLGGSLREVKRGFGRHAVALRAEGIDGLLDDPALVSGVKSYGDHVEVTLAEGADAQQLLKKLVAHGARVSRLNNRAESPRYFRREGGRGVMRKLWRSSGASTCRACAARGSSPRPSSAPS